MQKSPYPGRSTLAQGVAGQDTVGGLAADGETGAGWRNPTGSDRGDSLVGGVGGNQVMVGVVEPDPAQVFRWRGVQVAPEGELDGADADEAALCGMRMVR